MSTRVSLKHITWPRNSCFCSFRSTKKQKKIKYGVPTTVAQKCENFCRIFGGKISGSTLDVSMQGVNAFRLKKYEIFSRFFFTRIFTLPSGKKTRFRQGEKTGGKLAASVLH